MSRGSRKRRERCCTHRLKSPRFADTVEMYSRAAFAYHRVVLHQARAPAGTSLSTSSGHFSQGAGFETVASPDGDATPPSAYHSHTYFGRYDHGYGRMILLSPARRRQSNPATDPDVSAETSPRTPLQQRIEAQRAQLLQAHGVLKCLYKVLLHAECTMQCSTRRLRMSRRISSIARRKSWIV